MDEKILSQMNLGRTASVVYSHMRPVFDEIRSSSVAVLKQDYKAGKFDAIRAQCVIAELCVLDALENKLKQQSALGDRAARGEAAEHNLNLGDKK